MLPEPLHPAIVHFPIVLAILLPISASVTLWAIRRRGSATGLWAVPFALAAALTLSVWVAMRTGEAQEERVEDVVGEQVLHAHEEAAERLLALTGVVLVVAFAGFARGTIGTASRFVAFAGSLAAMVAGAAVGKSGGDLVYRHGAASAYVAQTAGSAEAEGGAAASEEREDDD
jgi:uncharacterized membrane protein